MLYFIVNPHARSGKTAKTWNKLEAILKSRNIQYTAYMTQYAGHATSLAAELTSLAHEDNKISLVILGGDGTINEVYNGISNHKNITIGYIPTGSGNDYARGLKAEKDPIKALDIILNSSSLCKIEHGILSDSTHSRRFAVSCGIGYDANITYKVGKSKLKKALNKIGLGKLVYTVIGIIQIIVNPKIKAEIFIDGSSVLKTDRLHFASVHVLKYEGGGFPFAINANPSDGFLSVCVFHDTGRLGFTRNLACSIFGKHGTQKGVSLYQCKTFDIKINKKSHVHTDGEDFGFISEMHAQVCNSDEFIHVIK